MLDNDLKSVQSNLITTVNFAVVLIVYQRLLLTKCST